MLNILFSLYFYKKYKSKVGEYALGLDSFGFFENGSFSFNFDQKTGLFLIGFADSHELKNTNFKINANGICDGSKNISKLSYYFDLENGNTSWNGKIEMEGVYKPILINCNNISTEFSLETRFSNPNTLLDSRWLLSFTLKPVTLSLFLFIFIFALYNLIKYRENAFLFSSFMVLAVFFSVFNVSFSYLELKHYDKSDSHTAFKELSITVHFVARVLIFLGIFLCSNGWGILNNNLDLKLVFQGFVLSSVYIGSLSVIENVYIENWSFLFIAIFLFFSILLVKSFIINIQQSEILIKGHLIVISQNGIDPSTTPVFKKLQKYETFGNIVITYFMCVYLKPFLELLIDNISFWLLDLFEELSDLYIILSLLILFRMTDDFVAGYEEIEISNLMYDDVQNLGVDSELVQNHSLRKWERGVNLPPLPIVIHPNKSKKEKDDNNEISDDEQNKKENNGNLTEYAGLDNL